MKALQLMDLGGPSSLVLQDVDEPTGMDALFADRDDPVVIDVTAAGVAFPELLQTYGKYQHSAAVPFVPGGEVAGIVRSAAESTGLRRGDRVSAFTQSGGFAEVVVAPGMLTFPLHPALTDVQGAGLIMNYHTAYFALVTRGQLAAGERVAVHGAAGGVGTATIQVAKGLGAKVVAIVSDDEKERVAIECGADHVVRSGGPWKDEVIELSSGGVDVVIDPVGGDRAIDIMRSLREGGRWVVTGFAGGGIPEIKVNRLLLKNISAVGAGWGAFVFSKPEVSAEIHRELWRLTDEGFIRPYVGATFSLADGASALRHLEERLAVGKVIIDLQQQTAE